MHEAVAAPLGRDRTARAGWRLLLAKVMHVRRWVRREGRRSRWRLRRDEVDQHARAPDLRGVRSRPRTHQAQGGERVILRLAARRGSGVARSRAKAESLDRRRQPVGGGDQRPTARGNDAEAAEEPRLDPRVQRSAATPAAAFAAALAAAFAAFAAFAAAAAAAAAASAAARVLQPEPRATLGEQSVELLERQVVVERLGLGLG